MKMRCLSQRTVTREIWKVGRMELRYEFEDGVFMEADFYGLGIGANCEGESGEGMGRADATPSEPPAANGSLARCCVTRTT